MAGDAVGPSCLCTVAPSGHGAIPILRVVLKTSEQEFRIGSPAAGVNHSYKLAVRGTLRQVPHRVGHNRDRLPRQETRVPRRVLGQSVNLRPQQRSDELDGVDHLQLVIVRICRLRPVVYINQSILIKRINRCTRCRLDSDCCRLRATFLKDEEPRRSYDA